MNNQFYKAAAFRASQHLQKTRNLKLKHGEALELMAVIFNQPNWQTLQAIGPNFNNEALEKTSSGQSNYKKNEIDMLKADLASVEALISSRTKEEDPIGYFQWQARREELSNTLLSLNKSTEKANNAIDSAIASLNTALKDGNVTPVNSSEIHDKLLKEIESHPGLKETKAHLDNVMNSDNYKARQQEKKKLLGEMHTILDSIGENATLPISRPASPWKDGPVLFTDKEGNLVPYEPGTPMKTTWIGKDASGAFVIDQDKTDLEKVILSAGQRAEADFMDKDLMQHLLFRPGIPYPTDKPVVAHRVARVTMGTGNYLQIFLTDYTTRLIYVANQSELRGLTDKELESVEICSDGLTLVLKEKNISISIKDLIYYKAKVNNTPTDSH